jgi:hypothetical protein
MWNTSQIHKNTKIYNTNYPVTYKMVIYRSEVLQSVKIHVLVFREITLYDLEEEMTVSANKMPPS